MDVDVEEMQVMDLEAQQKKTSKSDFLKIQKKAKHPVILKLSLLQSLNITS